MKVISYSSDYILNNNNNNKAKMIKQFCRRKQNYIPLAFEIIIIS